MGVLRTVVLLLAVLILSGITQSFSKSQTKLRLKRAVGVATARAAFGETCDRNTRCDSRASLLCSNGTCQCVKFEEMTYDNKKGKCVVLSGERCSYTAVEMVDTGEKRWTENLDCVDNARCNGDGYCDCQAEFFESPEGSCIPKRLQGGTCASNVECRTDKHLICTEGKCSCNTTESAFDSTINQCVAKVGFSCIKFGKCVPNAFCQKQNYNYRYSSSPEHERCTCSSDYTQSRNGLCLANYGKPCNVDSTPCNENWACINDKCQCHFPDHQVYDSSLEACVSLVRGPCREVVFQNHVNRTENFLCVSEAECRADNGFHECLCKYGFIEGESRSCSVAHGHSCTGASMCDKMANLHCKEGKCSCPDFHIYDGTLSTCRGLVGAKCKKRYGGASCVEGAVCQDYRDPSLPEGVCGCKSTLKPRENRTCARPSTTPDAEFILIELAPEVNFTTAQASSESTESGYAAGQMLTSAEAAV